MPPPVNHAARSKSGIHTHTSHPTQSTHQPPRAALASRPYHSSPRSRRPTPSPSSPFPHSFAVEQTPLHARHAINNSAAQVPIDRRRGGVGSEAPAIAIGAALWPVRGCNRRGVEWDWTVPERGGGEAGEGGDGAAVPDAPGGQRLHLQALQNPPRPRRRHHLQGPSLSPHSLP
jgi:hypothetical protein